MDLDTNVVAEPSAPRISWVVTWVRSSSRSICSTSTPVHGHGLDRQAKGFAGGRQRHLDETCRGHDGLAVHLVIGQPGNEFGADIRLPHMIAAGRHFNVHPQQRMSTGRLPVSG